MYNFAVDMFQDDGKLVKYEFDTKKEVIDCINTDFLNVYNVYYKGRSLDVGTFLIMFSDYLVCKYD